MMRHLLATLALLAATGIGIYLTPPVADKEPPRSLRNLETVAGWRSMEGVPEALLPRDPNEKAASRLTYQNAGGHAFVSVAFFTGQDDPARRPSINFVYPRRGASLIEGSPLDLTLGPDGDEPVSLPAVVIHAEDTRLAVLYWHQIGTHVYASDYWLRLTLLARIILARRGDSILVRVAVPADGLEGVPAALRTAGEIAPLIYRAVADVDR
jgi:EpsI family protein